MNMGSMSSGSDSDDSSNTMMSSPMVFTTDHSTPLYSSLWTPNNTSSYAGTCIFLIFLSVISRLLFVWRRQLELRWLDAIAKRRYVMIKGDNGESHQRNLGYASSEKMEEGKLTARGVDERVRVLLASRTGIETSPWRFSIDLPRACVFTVQAGIGYLLWVSS